jgi:DNA-directed RNA polymerase specialized sigma24 family protein
MYIIFAIVRNTIFDFRKKENKYNNNDITDSVEVEDIEDEEYFKYEFVKEEIDKIDNWYDKAIITHYVNDFHTIRSLAKVTSIGYTSIQPTIHRFRLQCQANWIKKIKNDKN